MPVFFEQELLPDTRLAVWHITEDEPFFLQKTCLQKEITNSQKRLQYLAGRYLLSYLFPAFPQDDILIADTRKPYLATEEYHFSISHSGDYAAAIVSRSYRTGIDVERYSPQVRRVRDKFLGADELQMLNDKESLQSLTLLWSAKESIYKWWSYGGVRFSENIIFTNFDFAAKGMLPCVFSKCADPISLDVNYRMFDAFCLTYVITDAF